MESLLTTQFDDDLKESISHLANYPEMLPFIGKDWNNSKRILFLGESHYLPYQKLKEYSGFDYSQNWYQGNSQGLGNIYRQNIRTRNNILVAEGGQYEKPLAIYFNLKRALRDLSEVDCTKGVFSNFSFYNYFQKPASIKGVKGEDRSVRPSNVDKKIAYETLVKVVELIDPKTIIFVSKKAFDAFREVAPKKGGDIPESVKIDFVPHAGRQWWYRKSRSYGNRTGQQKFKDLIKESYLD